jgi:phosphate starvation-inducible protein PhoH
MPLCPGIFRAWPQGCGSVSADIFEGERPKLRNLKITLPERGLEALFGPHDQNIKYLESLLSVRVGGRGAELIVEGDEADVAIVERILKDYGQLFNEGRAPSANELRDAFKQIADDRTSSLRELLAGQKRINPAGRKQVTARGPNQKRYLEAIENNDLVFGIGPAGTGKCIASDSLALTDRGMIEIGALGAQTMPQDQAPIDIAVYGLNGVESASHIYNGGETETLRITTRFGFSIEATPEHPLLLLNADGELQWRRADQLRTGDSLALRRGSKMFGDRTTIEFEYQPNGPQDRSSKPVHLIELDAEFAYFMGALVGDGCLTFRNRVILSSADKPIVAAFENVAARLGLKIFPNGRNRPYDHIIASAQLYQLLIHLGMSADKARTKRIPRAILAAPEEIVAAFLRGLFDTDGTVEKRDGVVTLNSVSETLIRQTQIVLLNFGIVSSKSLKHGKYKGETHISHMLAIAGAEAERFHEMIGFTLERKRDRRQVRPHNPNVDVVPSMGTLIDTAVRSATLTHAEHKTFHDYRIERRRPSYAKLEQLVATLEMRGASSERLAPIRTLIEHQLLLAPITSIEPSRARVYDLTVPDTHSFVANGFINHNTYLAVAMAVQYLMSKRVNRIVLARPAVEAGEKLGFLPGDLQDKVDPYLRPLYDALFDLMDFERVTKFLEKRVIEVAPLAFMRGRTIADAFIILDEAQNTTSEQMKMFLTRIGFGSKAVITGDVTQIDLPSGRKSGLVEAQRVVSNIDGIVFIQFDERDVVRHQLVQMIIKAYDEHNKKINL